MQIITAIFIIQCTLLLYVILYTCVLLDNNNNNNNHFFFCQYKFVMCIIYVLQIKYENSYRTNIIITYLQFIVAKI